MDEKKNWNEILEGMSGSDEFLKLEAGNHNIRWLDDGVSREALDFHQKPCVKCDFMVEYKGTKFKWSVAENSNYKSLFGQITLLGRKYESLVGLTSEVVVAGEGKRKSYSILEALDLMKAEDEKRKASTIKVEEI